MVNDEVQRLQNPKNTKIEMWERERDYPKTPWERSRRAEREECGFFFLEDSGVNAYVFVGYVWALFLNFVGLFLRDENFIVGFFQGRKNL